MKNIAIVVCLLLLFSCKKKDVNPNLKCYRCELIQVPSPTPSCQRPSRFLDTCFETDVSQVQIRDFCGNDIQSFRCDLK